MTTIARKPKPRPQTQEVAADYTPEVNTYVVMIDWDKLHRHPQNRVIATESLEELTQSLQEHGQREPIRVRPLNDPIGHYEIISGERRYLAAFRCEPPIAEMKCIVEEQTDAQALIDLAVANAARQDLDPIERAELLTLLMKPRDQGGGGMARDAAGRIFGLGSESGIKNALRLLQLPQFFRDLLKAGKLPIAQARTLIPYPDPLLAKFGQWLGSKQHARELTDFCEGSDREIEMFIREETRPMDKAEHHMGFDVGWHACYFAKSIDDATRTELQIVDIPDDGRRRFGAKKPKQGSTRPIALNCKLWDKLQLPLAKAKNAEERQRYSTKSTKKSTDKTKPPTEAELKAKRKKADDLLYRHTRDWLRTMYRCELASKVKDLQLFSNIQVLLHVLLADLQAGNSFPSITTFNEWALFECGATLDKSVTPRMSLKTTDDFVSAVFTVGYIDFQKALWRITLWPSPRTSNHHPDLCAPGSIPGRLPEIRKDRVDQLAAAMGVSAETVWRGAAAEGFLRELTRAWLTYHNKEQLLALGSKLGVGLKDNGKRSDMVAELLKHHTPAKPLKLPPVIASVVKERNPY